jgi:hypothetical protein
LVDNIPLVDISNTCFTWTPFGKVSFILSLVSPRKSPKTENKSPPYLKVTMPPRVQQWVNACYQPLVLPQQLHNLPDKYLKELPKYNGQTNVSVEDHIASFRDCTDNLIVSEEDVYLILFVQSLEGDA